MSTALPCGCSPFPLPVHALQEYTVHLIIAVDAFTQDIRLDVQVAYAIHAGCLVLIRRLVAGSQIVHEPYLLSVQVSDHRFSPIVECRCFSFHGRLIVGPFAPRGLVASQLDLASYRFPSLASASSERLLLHWRSYSATILSIRDASPRTLWDFRCSPGYSIVVVSSMLSETPGGRSALTDTRLPFRLLPEP